jgi:hypothetical protein
MLRIISNFAELTFTQICLPICLPLRPSPQYLCTAVIVSALSYDTVPVLRPIPYDAALPDITFSYRTTPHCSVGNMRSAIAGRQAHATFVDIHSDLHVSGASGATIISKSIRHSEMNPQNTREW